MGLKQRKGPNQQALRPRHFFTRLCLQSWALDSAGPFNPKVSQCLHTDGGQLKTQSLKVLIKRYWIL